ncbi:DUF551 domain-containing protein [Enterobacter sp. DE0047]|uniref:DUF551 domain-containing protein n=1 Tax=Enterobacter sp. DE0047 TaxID=2584949 RepID=UPI00119F983E|nr:DUF551 domain-containing protein [Enterobacter sp. DE0047]
MNTLSNERLEQLAVEEDMYNFCPEHEELNALARELLALRKEREAAVPDYYVVITSVGVWQAKYKTLAEAQAHIKPWDKGYSIKALYTRLPAQPVAVPDEIESTSGSDYDDYYCDGWNACRDAMIKQPASIKASNGEGARAEIKQPALNSPVIPDCWIKCSERLPEVEGHYLVWAKASKLDGYRDHQEIAAYQAGQWSNEFGWLVTHWQKLPAAPHQEAK